MKKPATTTTDPLDSDVDFQRFGPVRRGAFAGADELGGPSLLALWEMPQLSRDTVLSRRGPGGRGPTRETVARSVRLPAAVWEELEKKAQSEHLDLHEAMRAALLCWLRGVG